MLLHPRGKAISSGDILLNACHVSSTNSCNSFSSLFKHNSTACLRLSLTGAGVEDLTISRPITLSLGSLYRTPSLSHTFSAYLFFATQIPVSAIASRLKNILGWNTFMYSPSSTILPLIAGSSLFSTKLSSMLIISSRDLPCRCSSTILSRVT